jgi:hypothetical protein
MSKVRKMSTKYEHNQTSKHNCTYVYSLIRKHKTPDFPLLCVSLVWNLAANWLITYPQPVQYSQEKHRTDCKRRVFSDVRDSDVRPLTHGPGHRSTKRDPETEQMRH